MIEPNMATMLAFLLTDAAIPAATLRPMLRRAVDASFNMISIDTDTSTSDTVIVMANGLAGEVDLHAFETALHEVCISLAKEIAGDGEGATKLIEVTVTAARCPAGQAHRQSYCEFTPGQDRSPRRWTPIGAAWLWRLANVMRKRTSGLNGCVWRLGTCAYSPMESRKTLISSV